MTADQLSAWAKRLEESHRELNTGDLDFDLGYYNESEVDEVIREIRVAWAEAVQAEIKKEIG